MKITLDVAKLEQAGKITREQRQWLENLADTSPGSTSRSSTSRSNTSRSNTSRSNNGVGSGINILVGFGVIAITAGMFALLPSSATALLVGVVLWGAAYYLNRALPAWRILSEICVLVGAFALAGGLIASFEGARESFVLVSLLFMVAAAVIKSQLMAVLAAWAIFFSVGALTGYFGGGYYLGVEAPTVTVLLFSALALGAFWFSKNLTDGYDRLALSFSRMCVIHVNFGFWVGSLWGDSELGVHAFSITWALALIAVGVWAVRTQRRFVVNTVTTFGAIHFYTQWFETIGASPWGVLIAGLITIGIALALWRYNQRKNQHNNQRDQGSQSS